MNALSTALKLNISNLTNFKGRQSRIEFWPYIGGVLAGYMTLSFIAMIIFMANVGPAWMGDPRTNEGSIDGLLGSIFRYMMIGNAAIAIIVVFLLYASVTRRLHDTNKPGWLGLIPVTFLFSGLVLMAKVLTNFTASSPPDMKFILLAFANNLFYLVSLVILIIFLASPGTAGPNRFGDASGT